MSVSLETLALAKKYANKKSAEIEVELDGKLDISKQAEKTAEMNAPVGVDADGKLWSGGGGSSSQPYIVSNTEPTNHDPLWIDPSDDSVPQGTGAESINYDNSGSGLESDNVQDALDELAERGGSSTASGVSYDNSGSGLEATDVQDAIDELASDAAGTVKTVAQTLTEEQKTQARTNIGASDVTKVRVNGVDKSPTNGVIDIGTVVTNDSGKENTSNKVTDITAVSTDTQYPSAKAVYKIFQNVCLVAVDSMNAESGSVTDISGIYSAGTTLTAVATANTGYRFMKWINGYTRETVSTNASYEFTVTGNTNLVAIFIDESIEIVPWATGTDEQIRKIVEAATYGSLSLADVWAVGDTRTVHLSAMEATDVGESHEAQDVEFVIMDFVCDGFSAGGVKPSAIVGLKNGLIEKGYMNPTNTNAGGWMNCKRRTWCNNVFKNAVPSGFRSIFKEFTWQQGVGGGATAGLNTTMDTFALPPEKAIFGSRSYSFADEAALYNQWGWYQTASNRIKKNGASGSASSWWEASPYSGNAINFCFVYYNGGANNDFARYAYCLAPFGCI